MQRPPLYPFLVAAFPILSLWSVNVEQARVADVVIALAVTTALARLAIVAAGLFVSGRDRTAALASLWVLLFLSYGHIARVCAEVHLGTIELGRGPYVTAIAVAIAACGTVALRAATRGGRLLTRTLTVVAVTLVGVSVLELAASWRTLVAHEHPHRLSTTDDARTSDRAGQSDAARPDVYYIVLDGYASYDTLRDVYGFDNSPFYGFLRRTGFSIAASSRSNYPMTLLSLASSLNMRYLDAETHGSGGRPVEHAEFVRMVHDSSVLRAFRAHGYRTVHFSSGWDATEVNPFADVNIPCGRLSDFSTTLIRSTFVRPLDWYVTAYVQPRRITCEIEQLAAVPDAARPSFVFAHIVAPHPPFVFGRNGEWLPDPGTLDSTTNAWGDRAKYVDEIRAVNRRLRVAVERILREARRPVMIVLQGDHGPASLNEWTHPSDAFLRERLTILNAYLVPTETRAVLYPSMTPVNSFRALLSTCFGDDLPPLEDRSYFATYEDPFALVDVTDRLE